MEIKKKSILQGAMILAAASIVTRLLGFVYRIYMSNVIGAEGMGLYQLIMPLYGLAWSIACSGVTTSVSKLVAQENAKGEYGNMGRLLKQALCISCGIACVLSVAMFSGAEVLAVGFFKDARIIMPVRILSAALPFMAAGSAIRGYFLGLSQPHVPAIAQVLEQVTRMTVIYLIAGAMIPLGLMYACAAAVIGIVCEEFVSFAYMMYSYRKFKLKYELVKKPSLPAGKSLVMLVTMALPLTANRVSGSLLATLENVLIPMKLQQFGMSSKEAISAFGRIQGMAMPLIFFPSAVLTALSVSLVPAVSEAMELKNKERVSAAISKSLLFTALTGIGTCGIFLVLPDELGMVIYNQDISEMLFLLGIMCPLWYINITMSGILNGLGQQVFIFKCSLLSSIINISFIYFLVPLLGINGFIFGWFAGLVIVTLMSIWKIKGVADIKMDLAGWFLKPAIASAATAMTVEYISRKVIFPVLGGALGLAVSILLIVLVYAVFVVLLGCVKVSELEPAAMFGGRKRHAVK